MKFRNDFLNILLNALSEQIAVIDETGVILYVNQTWINFATSNGLSTDFNWIGLNYLAVCNDGEDDLGDPVCKTTSGIIEVIVGKRESYRTEYPCDSPTQRRWFMLYISQLHGMHEKLFLVTHTNITERKLAEDKANLLSMSDGLTGLANRRHLNDFLNTEWRRGLRSERPLSVLLIDIDYFKQYNDTFGHIRGDMCLVAISNVIKKYARRPGDLAARFGGEEFVLILSETELADAQKTANAMRKKINELAIPHIKNSIVSISIGVSSVIPNICIDEIYLLNQADKALYLAKNNGRNRVESCVDTPTDIALDYAYPKQRNAQGNSRH